MFTAPSVNEPKDPQQAVKTLRDFFQSDITPPLLIVNFQPQSDRVNLREKFWLRAIYYKVKSQNPWGEDGLCSNEITSCEVKNQDCLQNTIFKLSAS